jgi:hypothetical protein
MTTDPETGTTAPAKGLPVWLHPFAHTGLCYDHLGAITFAGGVAGTVVLNAAAAGLPELLAEPATVSWTDFIPDPAAAAPVALLVGLMCGAALLYRHWRWHRARAAWVAYHDELAAYHDELAAYYDDLIAGLAAGEIDPQDLLAAGVITLADLEAVTDDERVAPHTEPAGPHAGDDVATRPLALVAAAGEEG